MSGIVLYSLLYLTFPFLGFQFQKPNQDFPPGLWPWKTTFLRFELQPQKLAFLHSMVISAYRHKWRLRGYQSVDHRIKDLQKLLETYNLENVAAFFAESID